MPNNTIVIIGGPTASGKSGLAIDVAREIGGVVLNADSMQIYQGMPVLSAVPSEKEKELAEHRLYEIFPPEKNSSVVDWLAVAAAEIEKVWKEGRIPVLVGGTGMYLDNLINGTTPIPETKPEVREKVMALLKEEGPAAIHELLKKCDPETAQKLGPRDRTRLRRAYEVWLDTGKKISDWHKLPMVKKFPDAKFIKVKILPSRQELDVRCFRRFDLMVANGAIDEVWGLFARNIDRNLPAMKALGVPELLRYCEGRARLDEAVAEAKLHTRQYAKRQRTWFANKFQADVTLSECYIGQKNIVNDVKKRL